MIKIDSNGIKRIVSESVTRILENYFSGNYNAFEEKETDGRESDEKTENAKEKERRNQVEDYFHNPGVDIAPYAYQLYNIDAKEGEDTNEMKNARSKFAKCLNHEENESGYPYSFTSSEITSLYSIISSNQLSESVKRSVKKAFAKTLNEGKYDNSPITKWVYWCFNYPFPQEWIPQIWGEGAMGEHMMKKFKEAYDIAKASGAMNRFFIELDKSNQQLLIDYVMNNY